MSDHPSDKIASYGSLEASMTRSARVLKPERSQELTNVLINDSPLHQEKDDYGVGGSWEFDLALEDKLFQYMEEQVSLVESRLAELEGQVGQVGGHSSKQGGSEQVGSKRAIVSLNDDDLLEVDEDYFKVAEIEFMSVEVERGHYKLIGETLQKLKQDIQRLKTHLESECTKLDLLVTLSASGDREKVQRRFVSRLNKCLNQAIRQMEYVLHNNNLMVDGVRQTVDKKENPINTLIRESPIGCVMWLHAMLFLALVTAIIFMYYWSGPSIEWTLSLRLLRSPILVVFLLFLYGINIKVWATYGVDYATIFSHPHGVAPTPNYMFKMASILTVLMTLFVASVIVSSPYSTKLPLKIVPLLMWLVLIAFLLNPFNVLQRSARYSFFSALVRILLSPFIFVYFSDFFLADQFNSSIAIFLDLEYMVCYLTADSWFGAQVDPRVCTYSGNGIRPIVSLLPAFWRFLQCLRCFYDTYNPKHLVNAGKYFSILPVVIFAALFSKYTQNHNLWVPICWYAAAFAHAVYTFLWDITGDWGLLTIRCTIFQRKLGYKHKGVYLLAILCDFILRFFWTIKLSMAIVGDKSELQFTGLAVAEILRRFSWNFFRIEYAHMLSTT